MSVENIFKTIETLEEKYIEFLCDICSFEAKADDKKTIDAMVEHIEGFAKEFDCSKWEMERCGDFLSIDFNKGEEKGCVFLAHMDTVHEKGAFGKKPVTRLPDRIIAPGAMDCKGGIAVALLAMKALKENGYKKHLRLILTSDEEVSNTLGAAREQEFFREKCVGFPMAINCEGAEGNRAVVSRKGILKCRIDIKGVGGHSGVHYFECNNAIEEAAHKILALSSQSRRGGITYSCNMIGGGSYPNIIPDSCSVTVDVRFPKRADFREAKKTVERIAGESFIGDTTSEITIISQRPPMEKNQKTMELFEGLKGTSEKYDLGSLVAVESGGGSDSCYTDALGIPSICGMGINGKYLHTDKEYALTDSIPLRAKIISAFLWEK